METQAHPVLGAMAVLETALKDVADVEPVFMSTAEKRSALVGLDRVASRLEELRLRVLAAAEEVAAEDGARDQAAWLAHRTRGARGQARRDLRLARSLDTRWHRVGRALGEAEANPAQAAVIVRALEELPADLDREVVRAAEARLVAEAARFGPVQLRILGRRILEVVAPEVGEEQERRLLDREEAHAAAVTFLATRRRGDGTARATGVPTTRSSGTPSARSWRRWTRTGCRCTAGMPPP